MDSPHFSFVTFGMFIVDEIEWQSANPPPPKHDLIGGAGTYAVLGARLASSPCQQLAKSISWIVDIGLDFPSEMKTSIDRWNTNCVFRTDMSRLTTRAWNGYGDNEHRSFKYLTPKVRLEVSSMNHAQLMSKSFHMVCSSERCLQITTELSQARSRLAVSNNPSPVIIWEPIPDLCSPEELQRLRHAARNCSVISPNEDELKMFFVPEVAQSETQAGLVSKLLGWDMEDKARPTRVIPVPIIREGSNGSTAYFARSSNKDEPAALHLPAYHTPSMSKSVIDPTGGGNTYLGALAIALTNSLHGQASHDLICKKLQIPRPSRATAEVTLASLDKCTLAQMVAIAMVFSLIAASFALEQNGTPQLEQKTILTEVHEYWNGESFLDRLRHYLKREGESIRAQLANGAYS